MFFEPVLLTRRSSPSYRSFDRSVERFFNTLGRFEGAKQDTQQDTNQEAKQDGEPVTLTLDVPGVAREDLTINIEGAFVTIQTKPEAKRQYARAYELADEIDADTTSAKLENGVLTLTLGKKKPVSNARTVEIK